MSVCLLSEATHKHTRLWLVFNVNVAAIVVVVAGGSCCCGLVAHGGETQTDWLLHPSGEFVGGKLHPVLLANFTLFPQQPASVIVIVVVLVVAVRALRVSLVSGTFHGGALGALAAHARVRVCVDVTVRNSGGDEGKGARR